MEENKEEMPHMTAAEFVRLATNQEVGDPVLWAYIVDDLHQILQKRN